MADLTDFAKDLLGRALCARAPALPTQVYLGLGTGGAATTGLTGEPSGTGYARQRVTFGGTGQQQNLGNVQFAFAAAAGTLGYSGLFDAASGGNALTFSPLTQAVVVASPGTVTIAAGALTIAGN